MGAGWIHIGDVIVGGTVEKLAQVGKRTAGAAAKKAGHDAKRLGNIARSGRPRPAQTARASAAAAKAKKCEKLEKAIDVAKDPLNKGLGQMKDELTRR